MEVIITGKSLEVTPRVREYVEKKLSTLQRHFKSVPALVLQVVLTGEKTKSAETRFVVEFTTNVADRLLRSEERGPDLYVAIDRASQVMDRQIERFKGRRESRRRSSVPAGESGATDLAGTATLDDDYDPRIGKVKRHIIKPMSREEAIDQMELLGHDFFLFFNRETEQPNLVYRRKAGDYGLIEAQVE